MNDAAGWAEPRTNTLFLFLNCDWEFGEKMPGSRSLELEGQGQAAAVDTC